MMRRCPVSLTCANTPQDDEINQHSQMAEKLMQQMLDQDEVPFYSLFGRGPE